MLAHIRPALTTLGLMAVITGVAYPLAITAVGQGLMRGPANGELLRDRAGRVVGSALIGQSFAAPRYLHPRPSAAGNGYDPTQSGGSNLGPMDKKLSDRIAADAGALAKAFPGQAIPADAVTASASGLDPEISPEYARLQAPRIAAARGLALNAVQATIDAHTRGRTLLVLGEPRVNVLLTNRALDALKPGAGS